MDYQDDSKFNSFTRRVCSLPFVPRNMLGQAMAILNRRKEEFLDHTRLHLFCESLLQYINDTWINGIFCSQDWNLFDIVIVNLTKHLIIYVR